MGLMPDIFAGPLYSNGRNGDVPLDEGPMGRTSRTRRSPNEEMEHLYARKPNPVEDDSSYHVQAFEMEPGQWFADVIRRADGNVVFTTQDPMDEQSAIMTAQDHVRARRQYSLYGYPYTPTQYKVQHAPPGGVTIQGKRFMGGQFIPAEVMAQASPAERAAVEGGQARGKPLPPPGGAKLKEPAGGGGGHQGGPTSSGGSTSPPPSSANPPPAQSVAPGLPPMMAGDPIIQSPGLSPQDARLEVETQMFVRQNYPALRDAYLARSATIDAATGEVKSVTLNTDDWRDLIPGYVGTNSNATHEAASWCNKQLYLESIINMQGKGNNKFMILAGGGGSGKGTATGDFFSSTEHPIVLDQVSDRVEKLNGKIDEARANGYDVAYVFIDRPPEDAAGGIVSRALAQRQEGKLARTVNIDIGIKANIDARRTALQLLMTRPDVEPNVVDNRGGRFKRRLIVDRAEAIKYLQDRLVEDEKSVSGGLREKVRENIIARHELGEIPEDMVTGFLGPGWKMPPHAPSPMLPQYPGSPMQR